ncbi:MAG: cell division protein FtsQ [Gammaproteobacteria bacterium]|nr:cell division protein FtsQ [Gammaproteobacteria bacterium]MBU3997351.1 cell division protein FtsQ [Gammaproteobacteria bacterium]MBU4080024.1 cell division protein FtsQ [Gammaproteobacteria bacterium]MBU4113480.1 cell division protein FtsQ [Gammaproteobacteria bacterium]MBU4172102.1 cell division protein FtsQ [Gammaproteobacteria bacterium]
MTKPTTKFAPEEWAACAAMLGVMAAGLWQAAIALGSPAIQEIPITLADFREGRVTGAVSTQLDKNLPIRNELIAWANAGRYVLTHGAGDQVRLGLDDWLFSVEELQYFDEARTHQNARIAVLAKAAMALKAQGVTLIVAPVPDKARIYPQHLPTGLYPHWHADRYGFILETLRAQGVAVADLLPALTPKNEESPLYYRTDTHWNQHGAQLAAVAVAERVKAVAADLPPTSFETGPTGPLVQRPGDLLRMMGLSDMPNWARPTPDMEISVHTRKSGTAQPAGLFDNVGVPVVLIGTSYSLRANFHGHFQQALGAEVLNVSRDGGGFIQSAKDYFADESFKSAKPQVIVWEVPERVFSAPLSDPEKQALSL